MNITIKFTYITQSLIDYLIRIKKIKQQVPFNNSDLTFFNMSESIKLYYTFKLMSNFGFGFIIISDLDL